MKHLTISGIVSALLLTATTQSFAQSTVNGQFNTNTDVTSTCTVSNGSWLTASLYTVKYPMSTSKLTNKITVKCTKGTSNVVLKRDNGLNTTCRQNGLNGNEMLLKSDAGNYLPYYITKITGGRSSWLCDEHEIIHSKLNFSTTDTQDFIFELGVGSSTSEESIRLYNIAPAGKYSDTITFSVEF